MTARWCNHQGGGDFVLSGAGLWPLLALLASAADEQARAELAAALGRPVENAQQEALELIEAQGEIRGHQRGAGPEALLRGLQGLDVDGARRRAGGHDNGRGHQEKS